MNKIAIKASTCHTAQCPMGYNDEMLWVYFSPHFDDVALSCGGLVWEQAHAGQTVSIWTVCAGTPLAGEFSPFAQQLHSRWEAGQNATEMRRMEDHNSCLLLGANSHYLVYLDCIYRRDPHTGEFMYSSEISLNGPLHPGDDRVIARLQHELDSSIQDAANLVSPLALGNHVDHRLTRVALERLGYPLWYYADYPYVEHHHQVVEDMENAGWVSQIFPITREGLTAWQDSIAAHGSQISTFWRDEDGMRRAIETYWSLYNGICLWSKPVGFG